MKGDLLRKKPQKQHGIVFKKTTGHLEEGYYQAVISVSKMTEEQRLHLELQLQDGKVFSKTFPEELDPTWPFECWLFQNFDETVFGHPENLEGTRVQFVIKNNGRFSNFEAFDFDKEPSNE